MTGQQRLLAVSVFLSVTLVAFEITSLATAMPTISRQLHGDSLFGVTSAAYTLANMVALVAAGELADRRGPATPFAMSMAIFVVGLLVGAWAPTMVWVVVGRTLQGLGSGTVGPLAYVLIARAFPPERQPSMFALMSTGWLLPSLFAPAVSGWIVSAFGWRWVFLGIIPIAVVVASLAVIPMRAYRSTGEPTASRVPSAVRLAVGVGATAIALQSGSWWVAAAAFVVGVALAVSGGRQLFPRGLPRATTGLPAVLAVRVLATAAFLGVDSFVPLAADRVHHASPLVQGFTIIGAALLWSGGQWWRAHHPDVPASVSVRRGLVLMAFGAIAITPVLSPHWPLWAVFLGWAPAGFGMGMLFNPTTVAAMSYAEEGREGKVSSQVTLADSLGFAAMGAVGGATVAAADRGVWSIRAALGTNFAFTIALTVVAFAAARRVQART